MPLLLVSHYLPLAALPLCRVITAYRFMVIVFSGHTFNNLFLQAASLWVEKNSTVCSLPLWAKQQGYQFIRKTPPAAWLSLCSKWHLCIVQISSSKWQFSKWQVSLKAAVSDRQVCHPQQNNDGYSLVQSMPQTFEVQIYQCPENWTFTKICVIYWASTELLKLKDMFISFLRLIYLYMKLKSFIYSIWA